MQTVFPLVGAQWLSGVLDDPGVVVLDATFHLPTTGRNARAEFEQERIPGARFFDVDGIRDPENPLPHMVPSPESFAKTLSELGIGPETHVVCYDTYGLSSAPRAWWMLRLFGHERVSVLDGGLKLWKMQGKPLQSGAPEPIQPAPIRDLTMRADLIRDINNIRTALTDRHETILDARSAGRFNGTDPEPRPGLPSGHMPGARNLPFNELSDPETGRVLPVEALTRRFEDAGIRLGRDAIVTSCGSGVTACVLAFGLFLAGDEKAAVYDGSWVEWASQTDTAIEAPPTSS